MAVGVVTAAVAAAVVSLLLFVGGGEWWRRVVVMGTGTGSVHTARGQKIVGIRSAQLA